MAALLLSALAPACVTDSLSTSNQAASDYTEVSEETAYEQLRCDPDLCILHDQKDSDGDGFADLDEEATGTDPQNPWDLPEVADLAALIPAHALPSFETGNSMLILLPTMDANGLPVFGGDALTGSRKSALDRAGLSVPDGMNLGRGFSLTRSMEDMKLAGHDLMWAIDGGLDARVSTQVAGGFATADHAAVGHPGFTNVQEVYKDGSNGVEFGRFTGTNSQGRDVTVDYETGPNGSSHTHVQGDGVDQDTRTWQDKEGNSYSHEERSSTTTEERSGGTVTTETKSTTDTATSHDGRTTYSTTTWTQTTTYANGQSETHSGKTTKSCTDGDCETTDETPDGDDTPTEAGEPADDGTATAYRNPDHDEFVTPRTLHDVLVARGANINVVNPANGPIVSYTYTPEGAGNRWGPIALYGGDDGASLGTPSVLHVPSATPEYDPQLQHGLPPPEIPTNGPTCTYCAQP